MKSRKHLLTLLLCLFVQSISAQELSVKSFRLLENDLTANTHATMVKDRNGEVAALIKVVTTEQGFAFDGGMTGIVLIKQGTGEVWVYVPHGIKRINIQHQQFGVLRDYYFPIPIEKARTYELVLTTPKVETAVEQKPVENYNNVRANFFVLRTNEPKASIYVDGYPYQSRNDGSIQGMLPYGEHTYQVKLRGYETAEDTFTIDNDAVDIHVSLTKKKWQNISRWYIQSQFGGQHTIGEIAFNELNSLNAQIGIGYNINGIYGTRLTINGWQSRAGWETNNGVLHKWAWNYVSPVVDVTANLSNWIFGYNPDRLVNFGVFAGLGANVAFGNDAAATANEQIKAEYKFTKREALRNLWSGKKGFFTGRVGTNIDFRLSSNWATSLELEANAIDDCYNSKRSGTSDRYINALIGLRYTFD